MPDAVRIICTRCRQSVFNCEIEGPLGPERVPYFVRLNMGRPPDTGTFDMNGPNVRVPSVVRELDASPRATLELCVKCFAEVFRLPVVTAEEDPMVMGDMAALRRQFADEYQDESKPLSERLPEQHVRALHAIDVGWEFASPDDLPEKYRPPVVREGAA